MNSLESYGGSQQVPSGRGRYDAPGSSRFQDEWVLPTTRQEADERIVELSHDIGLILAQLSEDQVSWCSRTGRDAADYAAWRRRALFAKAHKEHQLRDCKRIRTDLADRLGGTRDAGQMPTRALAELSLRARRVIGAWQRAECQDPTLEAALADLAALFTPAPVSATPATRGLPTVVAGTAEDVVPLRSVQTEDLG